MRTYISDIIPRIQKFSQKLDNLTLLMNQHWVVIDDIANTKIVYIFRKNDDLLISQNGKVVRARWEYLGNNTLLIEHNNESYLYNHGFFDEDILALKVDSKDEYAFLVNETKYYKELNTSLNVIEFLNRKYNEPKILTSYLAPNYTLKKIKESNSDLTEHYIVEFEDGEKGEIFHKKKTNDAYFKAKVDEMWVKSEIRYKNLNFCINGLHYYFKTSKILKDGFIEAYV